MKGTNYEELYVHQKTTQMIAKTRSSVVLFTFLGAAIFQTHFADAQSQASPPSPSKTFTFRIRGEPETLDWNRAHTHVEAYILMNLMEGLVTFDANAKVAPALAQSWKVSTDGKTYTFMLRPGVKWSDGVALTAKDFVFSWKR